MTHCWLNNLLATLACFLISSVLQAQITLVKKGKPHSRVLYEKNDAVCHQAADLLSQFVGEITDVKLQVIPISEDKYLANNLQKDDIVILQHDDNMPEDAFEIKQKGMVLYISGCSKGPVYGVVTLLEKYLGVRYYTYKCYDLPEKTTTLIIPFIDISEKPAFRYRQTQCYAMSDSVFKMWFRLEQPHEEFVENMWVHTFNRILPSSVYGAVHPEWYSYINGKRQPGDHSQWCLTNEELYDAAVAKIDSIFKANPHQTMISVSQNDGNNTQCQCKSCREVDSIEGAPSGNLIRFMNKLAKRFPDKCFSTLAYLYSMQPPRFTRPLPNVNIMLCDIDCKREVPLTDNVSGQEFLKALKGWSAISDNIFVWDYGINFDNVVSPFPNFHILQPNLQTFKQHNATMVFEQINSTLGTDLAELRTFLCAKLMWNPYEDVDSLTSVFLNGYYGAAAPYINDYIKIMQGALLASDVELWIYDSPISHKHGMLNARLRKIYNELFDKAEKAVADDEAKLRRVQIARLPLMYSDLEIVRTESTRDVETVTKLLDRFDMLTKKFDIPTLNERHNKPSDYCSLYRKRFLPTAKVSKALGANVTYIKKPAKRYQQIADKALTDGLYGGTTFVESWIGWEGEDAEFIVDLGEVKEFDTVEADFLHQLGAWVLLPKGGKYSVSVDGANFYDFGSFRFDEDRDVSVKFVPGIAVSPDKVKARYIKVYVESLGTCPDWHYGVGYPAWFFIDELNVY